MAEVPREQDNTPEVTTTPPPCSHGAVAQAAVDGQTSTRLGTPNSAISPSDNTSPTGTGNRNPNAISFDSNSLYASVSEGLSGFLKALKRGAEGGTENSTELPGPPKPIAVDSCRVCRVKKEQGAGLQPSHVSDVHPDAKNKKEELHEHPGGKQLDRTITSKNPDGSTITVKTREEYIRDEKGHIKKNEDGTKQTRVLEEEKLAQDKNGNATFKSHTNFKYTKNGDLKHSHTDVFRGDANGKLSKYNSFEVDNKYDEKGNLSRHNARVLDTHGKAVQSSKATYKYDSNNNRISEDIVRIAGNNETTREHRDHTYAIFGDKFKRMTTESKLFDKEGKPNGHVSTKFERNADGTKKAEHTTEFDKQERAAHQFHAEFDGKGNRLHSTDVHTTWHENGQEKSVTTSEFNRDADSKSIKIEKDENGKIVAEAGIIQKMDGSIVSSVKGPNGEEKELLSAKLGMKLGAGDRTKAWEALEGLEGSATNKDVQAGFVQLGKFAGGAGKEGDAVERLAKWGQGDATVGLKILAENWGNGDGRAAQGIDTFLSLGAGASINEASTHSAKGLASAQQALHNLVFGGKGSTTVTSLGDAFGHFSKAVDALKDKHKHAERLREKIDPKADVAGEAISVSGNGSCPNGVCELRKAGDGDKKADKPGEKDAIEKGIEARKSWSPTGDFVEAVRVQSDIAGGDMLKFTEITDKMGTEQKLDENGKVVIESSRLSGNNNMLDLGIRENGSIDPMQAAEQFKRAGRQADGTYDGLFAAQNFYNGGVETVVVPQRDAQGNPVIGADGKPVAPEVIELHSAKRGVEGVIAAGGGNPVFGMDAMEGIATRETRKTNADGTVEVVREQLGMDVAFNQLPKIGERQEVVDGHVVTTHDSVRSGQAIVSYGAPPTDAQGNPIPQTYKDASGKEVPVPAGMVLGPDNKPIPQGVAGVLALNEMTRARTATGASVTDGSLISASIQAAAAPERHNFELAVQRGEMPEGQTFSAADTTRTTLQFVSRDTVGGTGTALRGAEMLTETRTAPDGMPYTISNDGSAVGGMRVISRADSTLTPELREAGYQPTATNGSHAIAQFTGNGTKEGLFSVGVANTVMMTDRTATGEPVLPVEQRLSGAPAGPGSPAKPGAIDNVIAYSGGTPETRSFTGGTQTIAMVGGGTQNPEAITAGTTEVRTAATNTTGGSVSRLAEVTGAASPTGDRYQGAEALMRYNGGDSSGKVNPTQSYSGGATALHTDLYGAGSTQPMRPEHVATAVSLGQNPGVVQPADQLNAGMAKTNEIVRSTGNPELTGSHVLTNLARPENAAAFQAVQQAPTPVAAREALIAQPNYAQITTPVVTSSTAAGAPREAAAAAAVNPVKPVINNTNIEGITQPLRPATVAIEPATGGTFERPNPTSSIDRPSSTSFERPIVSAAQQPLQGTTPERPDAAIPASGLRSSEQVVARETNGTSPIPHTTSLTNGKGAEVSQALAQVVKTMGGESGMFSKAAVDKAVAAEKAVSEKLTTEKLVAGKLVADKVIAEKTVADKAIADRTVAMYTAAAAGLAKVAVEKLDAVRFSASQTAAFAAHSARAISIGTGTDHGASKTLFGGINQSNSNPMLSRAVSGGLTSHNVEAIRTARVGDLSAKVSATGVVRQFGGDTTVGRVPLRSTGNTAPSTTTSGRGTESGFTAIRSFRPISGGVAGVEAGKNFTFAGRKKFRRLDGKEDFELLGAEIALAMLLVSATVAKERAEQKKELEKKKGSAEFAKLSDRLDEIGEFAQDDNSSRATAYQVLSRPTWLVRPNEDLVKLAEHLFHEAELGWLIADLNMGQTKESYMDGKRIVELRSRQKIDLPVWQDIVEFHKQNGGQKPENLITIVNEGAVDTELTNATLALAMGAIVPATPGITVTAAARVAASQLPAGADPAMLSGRVSARPVQLRAAGATAARKEEGKRQLFSSAKQAALAMRKAATAAVTNKDDQGPSAGAAVTEEQLQPKYV